MTILAPASGLSRITLLLAGLSLSLGLACGGRTQEPLPIDHVYVAGYESTGVDLGGNIPNQALMWVDGAATRLSPGSASFAIALAVDGEDVYAVGKDTGQDGQSRAVVWKNGAATTFSGDSVRDAYPTSIAVSNGTVAIGGAITPTGSVLPVAAIWLNGVLRIQSGDKVAAVALRDGGVVAGGWAQERVELGPNSFCNRPSPFVWQDDSITRLTAGIPGGVALGLKLSANDIYVAGAEFHWDPAAPASPAVQSKPWDKRFLRLDALNRAAQSRQSLTSGGAMLPSIAAYWKNGNAVYLSDGNRWAEGSAICVVGLDVYVAGLQQANDQYDAAVYWKNGVMVPLTQGGSEARAFSIGVVGSDVYVSGYEVINGTCVATYWKNGLATRLSDGKFDSFAMDMVVQRVP